MLKKFSVMASTIAAGSMLLACNSDSLKTPVAPESSTGQISTITSPWHLSPQKHNNSGISMRYRMEGALAVGQPVTIWFEFSGAKSADASVQVNPEKTLRVGANSGMQKNGDSYQLSLKPQDSSPQSMTFIPSNEGEHFINVNLTQNGQTSAAGIKLRVGRQNEVKPTVGERVTSDNGEKLIVIPSK